ncbi:putative transcription factor MYB-HB-like family [Helianthus annuus]|nr:putative transcription factor MYB-HB-like family [Helianthus annuus]
MFDKARHSHSFSDTKVNEEKILESFKDENEFSLGKRLTPDGVRNISQNAYQKNKKLHDAKSSGEDHEMNSSSKCTSMKDHCVGKKSKIIWTKALSKKFLEAVGILGIDKASPKKIQELMNVKGLTRDHVSSHLQKHRILLKKLSSTSCGVQAASKPCLLESSVVDGASLKKSSFVLNQEHMNWSSYSGTHTTNPRIVDTERSYIPFIQAANFNSTFSSALTLSGPLPNKEWNANMEKGAIRDDMVLTETEIDAILSFADENGDCGQTSNNVPATLNRQNKDANGQNFPNIVSFDSNLKEKTASTTQHQTSN